MGESKRESEPGHNGIVIESVISKDNSMLGIKF